MNEIIERIKIVVQPLITEKGFELYDMEYKKEPYGFVLRLFIDNKTRNISLDECADISHLISELFDKTADLEFHNFNLEVSSPGLDRLLRNDSDFYWAMGKTLKVKFVNSKDKKEVVEGKLEKINTDTIELKIDKKNIISVQKDKIESARRVMKFEELLPQKVKGEK